MSLQDLDDPERTSAHLATVSGLPEEDCLAALRELKAQLQQESPNATGFQGFGYEIATDMGSLFSSATVAPHTSMDSANLNINSDTDYPLASFSDNLDSSNHVSNIYARILDDWNQWYIPPEPAFCQNTENWSASMTAEGTGVGEPDQLEVLPDSSDFFTLNDMPPNPNKPEQEPVPVSQSLNCNELWYVSSDISDVYIKSDEINRERLQACPNAQNGEFDLDGLCQELTKKAKCSGVGPVVGELDFDTILSKFMGKDVSKARTAARPGVEIRQDDENATNNGITRSQNGSLRCT
jgi:hypothetical protein